MNSLIRAICAALILPGCSGQIAGSDQSALAPSHAAMTCDSSEVEKNASQKLVEWLKEKIVDNGSGNLHLNGDLQSNISTSVSIGELPPTQQCFANVTLGFKDAGGALHIAEPVSIRFNFSAGLSGNSVIELNEASLLQDGGAFSSASLLLVQEDERETAAPDTSGAKPFDRVPYVLRHCFGAQCKDSSVTSVSEKACEISRRLVREYDASGSYECVKAP
jgi:hypothetical protein